MTIQSSSASVEQSTPKLGTFFGVFLPVLLSLLGLVVFLRLSWIVGAGGLSQTLAMVALAYTITFLTAFSVSATATNRRIGGGGVYYVLSRTFGLEAGSAISLPLYIAQAFTVSFCLMGFAEWLSPFFPGIPQVHLSLIALAGLTLLSYISTVFALRSQTVIFFLLFLALSSIFLGKAPDLSHVPTVPLTENFPFWVLFPILFPGVTGIESGLGIAADLKRPGFSLPIGMLGALLVGFTIYVLLSIFVSHQLSRELLMAHPQVLREIAYVPQIVLFGILGGCLSAALNCMVSAPKVLQALASDGVLLRYFAKTGPKGMPRPAIIMTALVATIGILIGDINKIAPVLTMVFLLSYSMLNLASGLEGFFDNPSWRPTFSVHPLISFSGFALCLFCMLMMNPLTTILAFLSVGCIYAILKKRSLKSHLDDMRYSILMFISRSALYRLERIQTGAKSWRPNLLVFVGDPILRAHLIQFTENLTHSKSLLSIASIYSKEEAQIDFLSYKEKMSAFYQSLNMRALHEIKEAPTVMDGMQTFLKDYGMGRLVPNTILLGTTKKRDRFTLYAQVIMTAYEKDKNVILIQEPTDPLPANKKGEKRIDVWWGGQSRRNSDLMLVLAYMLQTSNNWKGSTLNLKTLITQEKYREVMLKNLSEFTSLSRLHVQPEALLIDENERVFEEGIKRHSEGADLVLLGLRAPKADETVEEYARYYATLLELTKGYPPIAFVLAGEIFEFGNILK
jgi:amino acid transporter